MSRGTPFDPRTGALAVSRRWKDWAGFFVAEAYQAFHDPEYHAARSAAALFDVSPLRKYDFRGPDALALADRLVTRSVARLPVGGVLYAPWCDEDGGVLQDGTFQRISERRVLAASVDAALPWFERVAAGLSVEVEDVSDRIGVLALQGPAACRILNEAAATDLSGLRPFRRCECAIGGVEVGVTRTGFTGDLGYELWVDAADALPLWDRLMAAGAPRGLRPAGMLALDRLRIEAGFPLIGVDFHNGELTLADAQRVTPFEIGLGWAVSRSKPDYVGREALVGDRGRAAARRFVGIETSIVELERLFALEGLPPEIGDEASRNPVPVWSGGEQIGHATSIVWSPLLKRQIALATVGSGFATPGTEVEIEVTVEYVRRRARSRVAALPFFDPPRRRRTPAPC